MKNYYAKMVCFELNIVFPLKCIQTTAVILLAPACHINLSMLENHCFVKFLSDVGFVVVFCGLVVNSYESISGHYGFDETS